MSPDLELNRSQSNPIKGAILYLTFLPHFWSYNNSLKITVYTSTVAVFLMHTPFQVKTKR